MLATVWFIRFGEVHVRELILVQCSELYALIQTIKNNSLQHSDSKIESNVSPSHTEHPQSPKIEKLIGSLSMLEPLNMASDVDSIHDSELSRIDSIPESTSRGASKSSHIKLDSVHHALSELAVTVSRLPDRTIYQLQQRNLTLADELRYQYSNAMRMFSSTVKALDDVPVTFGHATQTVTKSGIRIDANLNPSCTLKSRIQVSQPNGDCKYEFYYEGNLIVAFAALVKIPVSWVPELPCLPTPIASPGALSSEITSNIGRYLFGSVALLGASQSGDFMHLLVDESRSTEFENFLGLKISRLPNRITGFSRRAVDTICIQMRQMRTYLVHSLENKLIIVDDSIRLSAKFFDAYIPCATHTSSQSW